MSKTVLMSAAPTDLAHELTVHNPFDGTEIGRVAQTLPADIDHVIERASLGFELSRRLSRFTRHQILSTAATLLEAQREVVAQLIVREAGKTIRQARKEVDRAVSTLSLSADTARSNAGELIPFDAFEGSENRTGWFTREPLGIVAAITPYNDPLNLVAHKLGPAIAGGNAVILKPSQLTPLTARVLVDVLIEAGLPDEVVTVVCGDRTVAQAIVGSRTVRMVSFTGGFATGEAIARTAGLKRLSMELGGNAPVLVFDDADIAEAVELCVSGAFWAAGQNCVGAQRILIQRASYHAFREQFVAATAALRVGDPRSETTDIGPMISVDAARRAQRVVDAARAAGAKLLIGGHHTGTSFGPTVLEDVPFSCEVWADEAFAPIVVLQPFDSEEEALRLANEIEFSLHAGVFTNDLNRALRVSSALEAGGVMINDSSDFRVDGMPFGGAKYGSMGREGVRFAFEEMTQPKVVCINA
ncbi:MULTISPECIES: aldehyde dehydrogenase family protein [unclassified Leifsonia]|uniref:aldehyde dehydrogenase family protein n=1 Tax=unclassified Leifsonia TaxID=2663824 RepID=UPI0008A7C292|nr:MULTISPECIES: aldehyde dehydrogenase family protein [unclassified Leifsonia]SEI02910.1 Aldehyde dehydrogenase family protein [Leifsonia sp. CL154]SFL71954.1 Aldehyde dehydrogenase family protein [Leifsonia sp. CL147]